jgi:hypothetical protein
MCCVCIFLLYLKSLDLILEDKPLVSEVVLSHVVPSYQSLIRIKHTLKHLKITTTLLVRNA